MVLEFFKYFWSSLNGFQGQPPTGVCADARTQLASVVSSIPISYWHWNTDVFLSHS
jgi:hypothetical protein